MVGDKPPCYNEESKTQSVIPANAGIHLLRQVAVPCRAGDKPRRYKEESKTKPVIPANAGRWIHISSATFV